MAFHHTTPNPHPHPTKKDRQRRTDFGPHDAHLDIKMVPRSAKMDPATRAQTQKESRGVKLGLRGKTSRPRKSSRFGYQKWSERMKTQTFYEHGFEFHLRHIPTGNGAAIEPLRPEKGSQKRGISKKLVFKSDEGFAYENHNFGPSRTPAVKMKT